MKPGYAPVKRSCFAGRAMARHVEGMAQDPDIQIRPQVAKAERMTGEGFGLDRIVTAVAFLATVALILLSPFG